MACLGRGLTDPFRDARGVGEAAQARVDPRAIRGSWPRRAAPRASPQAQQRGGRGGAVRALPLRLLRLFLLFSCRLLWLQLHGGEPARPLLRRARAAAAGAAAARSLLLAATTRALARLTLASTPAFAFSFPGPRALSIRQSILLLSRWLAGCAHQLG